MLGMIDLQKEIRTKSLQPFYVFIGDEIELQNIYIQQMGDDIKRVETVESIIKNLHKSREGLFAKVNKSTTVYVIRDDLDFVKSEKKYKDIVNSISQNRIVFQLTNDAKFTKFLKYFKGCTVKFDHLTTPQLVNIFKNKVQVPNIDLEYFIEACNNDYKTILNYLDIFSRLKLEPEKAIVDQFIPENTDKIDIFKVADKITSKDYSVFELINKIINREQIHLILLGIIYNHIHRCILVEGYKNADDITAATGLPYGIWKNVFKYNKLQPSSLLTALRIIRKYDIGFKNNTYDKVTGIYNLILELLAL